MCQANWAKSIFNSDRDSCTVNQRSCTHVDDRLRSLGPIEAAAVVVAALQMKALFIEEDEVREAAFVGSCMLLSFLPEGGLGLAASNGSADATPTTPPVLRRWRTNGSESTKPRQLRPRQPQSKILREVVHTLYYYCDISQLTYIHGDTQC